MQLCSSLSILGHCLSLGVEWKQAFQSCGHCWVFQICWHTECSTFTASSFRIWNSSTGISSPPPALFVVMLLKAQLTSHSRMSGSRWVISPRDYLGHEDLFCSFLLCIFATSSYRSNLFLYFIVPIIAWKLPLISLIFLKRSLVFPILLFSSISLHWLLRKAFLALFVILWNSAFRWVYLSFSPLPFASLLFSAICKASSDYHFALLHFFFLGLVLIFASYTVLQTSIHSSQELCLSDLIPWIYLSLPLYNCKGFDLGHTWMV